MTSYTQNPLQLKKKKKKQLIIFPQNPIAIKMAPSRKIIPIYNIFHQKKNSISLPSPPPP